MKTTPERLIKQTVASIPKHTVATYGQIAEVAGLPGRARLVARVLSQGDGIDKLPWHRVLRADGRIAPRPSAHEQRERLERENVEFVNGRVDLQRFGWLP